jgi:hypothetical protein
MQKRDQNNVLFLLIIFNILISVESFVKNNNSFDLIFASNFTKCFMFSENCQIDFLQAKTLNLTNEFVFESSDEKIFTIKTINASKNLTRLRLKNFNEYKLIQNKSISEIELNYDLYEIQVKTGIIGKAYLYLMSELRGIKYKHQLIIQTETRIIDK